MKIACPACGKALVIRDELAGRRVKCPGCQEVFEPSGDSTEAITTRATKAPSAAPRTPRRDQVVVEPSRAPSRRGAAEDHDGGRCYIDISGDEINLCRAIHKRVSKLIESEQLDLTIMSANELPPDELRPGDVVISGEVISAVYGSQFVRYFLTFLALIGPGSCQLKVEAEVVTGKGRNKRLDSHSRRWIGVLGGSGNQLMKENVRSVTARIANGSARFLTGRRMLNAQVYSFANWSLGLGLVALVPFLGIPFSLVGLVLGLMALLTINKRELPRGRNRAISGFVLSLVGLLITAGGFLLIANQ